MAFALPPPLSCVAARLANRPALGHPGVVRGGAPGLVLPVLLSTRWRQRKTWATAHGPATTRVDARTLLLPPSLHRRRRAPGRIRHAAWPRADAGLHAGRHASHGEGAAPARRARDRRRDPARQYLSSDAAAGGRARRRAGRPA